MGAPPPGPGRGRMPAGARVALAAAALAFVGAAAWSGCTVTKENYAVLSFWFDGVPDPSKPVAAGPAFVDPRASPTYVIHRPYAEDKCDSCHATRFMLTRNSSGVCMKCHEGVPTAYDRMHGPVAAVACLWCHSPHDSPYEWLMRDQSRTVCAQCHTPDMLNAERVPAHADAARSCLECHFGHGGREPWFLKEGARARAAPPPTPPEK